MTDHLAVLEEIAEELRVFGDDLYQGGAALHGFADRITAAIALMRGQSWQPIESCPRGDRRVILLISVNGPNGYITDPWTGWMNSDGTFARWPHEFPPSHWRAIEPKYPVQTKDAADEQ